MDNWFLYMIYAIAYCSSIAAFSFNSIFWLRGLTIFSSILFVFYYYIYPVEPLWIDIFAEAMMVLVNLLMILLIMSRQRKNLFTEEEKEVHEAFFSNFSPFEFYKLIRKGEWVDLQAGHKLISKNTALSNVYFIYNGLLKVHLEGEQGVDLTDGYFVGERSFKTREPANADVYISVDSRLISWDQEELRSLLRRNPAMRSSFDAALHEDLSKKLYK